MKDTEIIEKIRAKLSVASGRHLYGVLGSYGSLGEFAEKIQQAKMTDGKVFPQAVSVNQGIFETIPDDEFRELAQNEARRPEPTSKRVAQAFETFLRQRLDGTGVLILSNLEILFSYQLELNLLRTLATDNNQIVLLLPGKREGGRVVLFADYSQGSYILPSNLIADNHLWELKN